MTQPNDGGPAFPCAEDHKVAADIPWTTGMSKRELFAAILMHGELVTCGVPGEAADALVEASRAAGDDVVDHMAGNAVENADALLRALDAPQPVEYRELLPSEQYRMDAGKLLYAAALAVKQNGMFDRFDEPLRKQITEALFAYDDAEIPF